MFNTKKKTVREVLASFDKMINELDAIVTDCDKGIEQRQLEIQQAQEGGVPRDHLQVGIEHRDALVEQIQPGAQHLLVTPLGAGSNAAFRLAGRFVVPVHRRSADT